MLYLSRTIQASYLYDLFISFIYPFWGLVDDYTCCDDASSLDHLKVLLLKNSDLICGGINVNMPIQLTNPPVSQTVYHETELPLGAGWQQGIACFIANDNYDRLLVYGEQLTPVLSYFLLDNLTIMPDDFPTDQTINVACNATATLDAGTCHLVPGLSYAWELQDPATGNWVDLGIDEPSYTTPPIGNQCQVYRLTRSIGESTYPLANDFACISATAIFTVCGNCCDNPQDPAEQVACCLANDTQFTINIGNPAAQLHDGRPAYILPANATWSATSNDFIAMGLASPGDPIVMGLDLVVPPALTLTLL